YSELFTTHSSLLSVDSYLAFFGPRATNDWIRFTRGCKGVESEPFHWLRSRYWSSVKPTGILASASNSLCSRIPCVWPTLASERTKSLSTEATVQTTTTHAASSRLF